MSISKYVLVDRDDIEQDYEYDRYDEAEEEAQRLGYAVIELIYELEDSDLVWTPTGDTTWPPVQFTTYGALVAHYDQDGETFKAYAESEWGVEVTPVDKGIWIAPAATSDDYDIALAVELRYPFDRMEFEQKAEEVGM